MASKNPFDNVTIDGENEEEQMEADAPNPPFFLFSPDLQENIGGPYAKHEHAKEALELMRQSIISPSFSSFDSLQKWRRIREEVEL